MLGENNKQIYSLTTVPCSLHLTYTWSLGQMVLHDSEIHSFKKCTFKISTLSTHLAYADGHWNRTAVSVALSLLCEFSHPVTSSHCVQCCKFIGYCSSELTTFHMQQICSR